MNHEAAIIAALEARLGRVHAAQRIGIEAEREARIFGGGRNFFHPENWYSLPTLVHGALKLTGLHGRARRNALNIELRHNDVVLTRLPRAFDGFTVLHLTDMHVDMNASIAERIAERVAGLRCDLCVLTGDYRAGTAGPIAPTIAGLRKIRAELRDPIVAVLGNHDSVRMVPDMETMGIRVLLNEAMLIRRGAETLGIAGVDDPHYYRVDNLDKAARDIPVGCTTLLLAHTPEIYRQAAHAGFDLMLCGHTHGGQLCLPGGYPVTLDARLPRRFGRGPWRHHTMQGYTSAGAGTSIADVRLNCPAEVTLHRLHCA